MRWTSNALSASSGLIRVLVVTATAGLAFGPAAPASAQDWTGATSSDWFTGSNWSTGTPPTQISIGVIIDAVVPNPTVVDAPGALVGVMTVGDTGTGSLTIQNGGTLSSVFGTIIGSNPGSVGTVTVTGAGSTFPTGAIVVGGAGTGTLTIGGGGTVATPASVMVATLPGSVGNLNIGAPPGDPPVAPGTLSAPSVSLGSGTGALNFNHTATDYVFSIGIGGPGAVNVLAGTTIFTPANTYSGPTLIDGGTLQAGAVGTFSPNSEHTVTSAGVLNLAGFSQTVLGLTNAGLVNFGAGTAPGTMLTTTNYVGQGGTLAMNTFLGTDASPSDRLVIKGGTASGNSLLKIANAGGTGALTIANGILVVDAVNGGTTFPGAFTLAGPVVAGPFEYTLFRGSVDGSAPQSWFLRSTLPEPGPSPCPLPTPEGASPPAITPPTPQAPNFRPEVSLNAALPNLSLIYGRSIVGTLHDRVGDEVRFAGPAPAVTSTAIGDGSGGRPRATPFAEAGPAPAGNGAWGRVIAEHGDRDGGCPVLVGPSFDYGFAAVQAGFDAIRLQHASGARDRAGVYGAFGSAHADVQSQTGADAGRDRFAAYSVGAYWTHYGAWGGYLDGVVQGTFYDVRDESTRLAPLETDGWGFAASLEAGYPVKGLLDGWSIEPQAQLVFQSIDLGDSGDIGARVRFDHVDSLAGRLGVRFATTWAMPALWGLHPPLATTAWFRPSYWHEFNDDPRTLFSSEFGFLPFRANIAEDWVELNTGLTVQIDRSTALFASGSYDFDVEGNGEAWDGKIGLKVVW
jgi:outer membrane autotransporter protein